MADWGSGTVFHHVESRKSFFHDTAAWCPNTGLLFRPLVFEAVGGGWSGGLGFLSCWLARESRRSTSLPSSDPSLSFAQRISSTLHRENARAILKRSPGGPTPDRSSLGLRVLAEDLSPLWPAYSLFGENFLVGEGPRLHSVMVVAYSWHFRHHLFSRVLTLLWSFACSPCPSAGPPVLCQCWLYCPFRAFLRRVFFAPSPIRALFGGCSLLPSVFVGRGVLGQLCRGVCLALSCVFSRLPFEFFLRLRMRRFLCVSFTSFG